MSGRGVGPKKRQASTSLPATITTVIVLRIAVRAGLAVGAVHLECPGRF